MLKEIQLFHVNKSSGPENIPIKSIKIVGIFIAPYLRKIFNESITLAFFPKV